METTLTAIETTGMIDEHRQLTLDGDLPITGPMRVRVIVLYLLAGESDEAEWLHAAAQNPAFSFFKELAEDTYTASDGKPFNDEV